MPTYEVEVSGTVEKDVRAVVMVEADNEEEARNAALVMASQDDELVWEEEYYPTVRPYGLWAEVLYSTEEDEEEA